MIEAIDTGGFHTMEDTPPEQLSGVRLDEISPVLQTSFHGSSGFPGAPKISGSENVFSVRKTFLIFRKNRECCFSRPFARLSDPDRSGKPPLEKLAPVANVSNSAPHQSSKPVALSPGLRRAGVSRNTPFS